MFGEARDFNTTFSSTGAGGRVDVNLVGEPKGHWITVFRHYTDIQKMDMQAKFQRTRPYQSLAVCMIASNEEDWIGGAIKSIKPFADDIVVAINGSTDQTEEICKRLGAEVRECTFDNFSQVRNFSKENIDTDWIFWMDADERLVHGDQLRKYMAGGIFNGLAVRQCHLMLDLPGTYDLPIRLFRNNPGYNFVGYIHEHCEDTREKPFDVAIAPTLVLPDVDIAHYGYLHERMRRYKCSARNLGLLLRDIKDNANQGRVLTWVLAIRDYLNIVKWSFERTGTEIIERDSFESQCLCAAVATFVNHFEDSGHRYEDLARPMYEEALAYLGKSGIVVSGEAPPFEVGLALFGSVGGLEDKNIIPKTRWFRNKREYAVFVQEQASGLTDKLGLGESVPEITEAADTYDEPDHEKLLASGLNVVERST
jgi:glycosyltransferase involved in cell wall biosynthesis